MLISGEVDAVWIGVPNFVRLDIMREIHRLVKAGWAKLVGVACEKPLGRTLAEAREMLRLAEDAKLMHGCLENQVFSSAVQRGKDIVWRRSVPVRSVAVPIWRAPPRSIAGRTCRGSGRRSGKAVASFPT